MAKGKQFKTIRVEVLYINYPTDYIEHFVNLIKNKVNFKITRIAIEIGIKIKKFWCN